MTLSSKESMGPATADKKEIAIHWDGRSLLARLALVIENSELFQSLRLVTHGELDMVGEMSESGLEYVLGREDCPIFTSINLKKDVEAQNHRNKLETALSAVFL